MPLCLLLCGLIHLTEYSAFNLFVAAENHGCLLAGKLPTEFICYSFPTILLLGAIRDCNQLWLPEVNL